MLILHLTKPLQNLLDKELNSTLLASGMNWKAGRVMMPCSMSVEVTTWLIMPNQTTNRQKIYILITFMS
jgi:hypothetical protein